MRSAALNMLEPVSSRPRNQREAEYILGHSPAEIRRLILQAAVLEPITTRLLRAAGIAPGMRVLDLGCGSGDVALLAAELVGPEGEVIGIDRSPEVLALARSRASASGFQNVEFREGAAETLTHEAPFDMAIGRYVLIHQRDPAAFIRAAAANVRPGGTIAFHEIAVHADHAALMPAGLWRETMERLLATFETALPRADAGLRMSAHFRDAGLPAPQMFCEALVGTSASSPLYAWLAQSVRSVLPHLEKAGAGAANVDIDTLEERLRQSIVARRGQALSPLQFCGWSRTA